MSPNGNLTVVAEVVAIANLGGTITAVVAQALALRFGLRTFRAYHLTALVLASVYAAGYAWLAFTDVLPAEWSETVRWAGLVAWPLVWVAPAGLSIVVARNLRPPRTGS